MRGRQGDIAPRQETAIVDRVAAPAERAAAVIAEGPLEKLCRTVCRLTLAALIVIIDLELVTRNLFGFSFYISDEYSGYFLVVLTFFSLPLCLAHGSLHRVTFILGRLPARVRAALLLGFDLVALVLVGVILWQVTVLVLGSRQLHTTAPTLLMTPLWLPQLAMPLGAAALCVTLCRIAFVHARDLLRPTEARRHPVRDGART